MPRSANALPICSPNFSFRSVHAARWSVAGGSSRFLLLHVEYFHNENRELDNHRFGLIIIVALGWFVTGNLNRKKDVGQRRLEYRLKALEAFLPVWFTIQKERTLPPEQGFVSLLEDGRSRFLLYGYEDEIAAMESFIHSSRSQDLPGANAALGKLVPLVRNRIRNELDIRN